MCCMKHQLDKKVRNKGMETENFIPLIVAKQLGQNS